MSDPSEPLPTIWLGCDYFAPDPVWGEWEVIEALIPEELLERLRKWQHFFDDHVYWETGWDSEDHEAEWVASGRAFVLELRELLRGKARFVVIDSVLEPT